MMALSQKPAFRLLLIVAFLLAYWSPSHIHLTEQHHHDGDLHVHELEHHSDHVAPKLFKLEISTQIANNAHQPDDSNILYIDASISSSKNTDRSNKKYPDLFYDDFRLPTSVANTGVALLETIDSGFSNEPFLFSHPRAPPVAA